VDQTYPVATALCVRAHAGTLPAKLQPSVSAVISACDTLENAFPPLVATVDAAESEYLSTVSSQKALVTAPCTRPVSNHGACATVRADVHAAIVTAHGNEAAAVLTFHTAVEANRKAFWSTIESLRGGSSTS